MLREQCEVWTLAPAYFGKFISDINNNIYHFEGMNAITTLRKKSPHSMKFTTTCECLHCDGQELNIISNKSTK